MGSMQQHRYIDHLICALSASLRAGAEILDVYGTDDFNVRHKADDSPLTLADMRSHELINEALRTAFPDMPVLSEEGRDIPYEERRHWPAFWLVDPLDGTKEFVKRNGDFTVNIAIVEAGQPVLGVVYVPVTDTLYFGLSGTGAYKLMDATAAAKDAGLADMAAARGTTAGERPAHTTTALERLITAGKRLPTRSRSHSDPVRVVASRSHFTPETGAFVDDLKTRYGSVETVAAGSSIKICLVAEGAADVYPRFGPTMEWDVAAGHAVALESGCRVVVPDTGSAMTFNKPDLLNPWFVVGRGDFVPSQHDL